jgi:hypothetical protein
VLRVASTESIDTHISRKWDLLMTRHALCPQSAASNVVDRRTSRGEHVGELCARRSENLCNMLRGDQRVGAGGLLVSGLDTWATSLTLSCAEVDV